MTTDEFDDVKFALAENLTGDAKKAANAKGITEGLVALGVKYGSPGVWSVEKVIGSPTDFINKKAKATGIDLAKAFNFKEE